jgi:hemoglobin-like flavoprotein
MEVIIMMRRKLVALGLGAILSANLLLPVMANEPVQDTQKNNSRLEILDKAFEEGKINEDIYEKLKERRDGFQEKREGFKERREDFKDKLGDLRDKKEERNKKEPMTKEEHLERLQEHLEAVEEKYEEGNIEQEKYNDIKEKILAAIEAVENGERPNLGHKEPLTQEQMLERLNEKLTKIEEHKNDGEIDEEKYEKIKEHIMELIEKVENGEKIKLGKHKGSHDKKRQFNIKQCFDFMSLSQEEKLELLNNKMSKLEEALSEGKIEQEKYEAVKEQIEIVIEKIQSN